MTIDERRALLRIALKESDPEDISGFAAAVDGADEDERTALARTLPPLRLFRAEGPTPRACFVLAALGTPKAAGQLFPVNRRSQEEFRIWAGRNTDAALRGVSGRGDTWCYQFIDVLCDARYYSFTPDEWDRINRLINDRLLAPESETYLRCFVRYLSYETTITRRTGRQIADFLRSDNRFLQHEFWALFRVDGIDNHSPCYDETWDDALLILCDEVPGFRSRLLDESLHALLRDFAPNNVIWYHRVHRLLDPTPDEIAARAETYLAVLGATASTSVGLAQDMLKRVIGNIDPTGLLDASVTVLQRTEKKLVKAQLVLLQALLEVKPHEAGQISQVIAPVVEHLPTDLVTSARRLMLTQNSPDGESTVTADVLVVPPPRERPLPADVAGVRPVADERELWELVSACLEGTGDGADLPRILLGLCSYPDATDPAMVNRAQTIMRTVWDWGSPRRQLASLLLARAGLGERYVPAAVNTPTALLAEQFALVPGGPTDRHMEPLPTDSQPERRERIFHLPAAGTSVDVAAQLLADDESEGWYFSNFDIVGAYLGWPLTDEIAIDRFEELVNSHKTTTGATDTSAKPDEKVKTEPLPLVPCHYDRVVLETPGRGLVWEDPMLTSGKKPFWLAHHASSQSRPTWTERAYDVSHVPDQFIFHAQEARDRDGYDQIVQWAAWLYTNNPDILAAQFHPTLWTATQVVNVRGVIPLMEALGKSYQLPGGPVYSALALGLSAKQADHRAAAAEAVAALTDHSLLVPELFATEITAHLKDGFVLAGRLADALSDAASISPITGYRVLQTLSAVLPHLDGVNQAAKLVELTAKLTADYGTPVPIPESLAGKTKGSSLMAVSLRLLADIRPDPTALAQAAAEQAAASLGQ